MRSMFFSVLLSAAVPFAALAQTADDLQNDEKTPGDVLVYGMGYSANRFSPLTQINKDNVSKLVPIWAYSLADLQGGESFPVVKDGVVYATTHNSTVAVDALTGKQIWRVVHDYPPETLRVVCCGIVNRGAAIYEGMVIRALMDDRLVALDAKTGKEIWTATSPEPAMAQNGYAMTGAPLIVNGVVIAGVAGAEFGHRGFLEGYDAKTGKHLWRLYTVPAKGEPGSETWAGDSQLTGGGSSWVTGTYDSELDLVYWGIGNPSPWNPRGRKGDNLFTQSIFAVRPKTGERVWYFQTSPNDPFDYDAVQTPIIATIDVQGAPRKVVVHDPNILCYLKAVDPMTGKSKWEVPYKSPNWSSTMVTASNLVFTGVMTGEFQALDADTGKILWSFQTPSGIIGQPVTWERDGKQYITVMSGIGGVYAQRSGDPNLNNLPTGVSLWTFALFDK